MAINTSTLEAQILADLSAEMGTDVNTVVLTNKIKLAVKEVIAKREYQNSSMTDSQIENELSNRFYATIENLARYDYNQTGTEGQSSHSENSVSRIWLDRNKYLSDVHAFVKVL